MDSILTYSNIGEVMTDRVPGLLSDYEEALFDGELMVHVFFGYVASYVHLQTRMYMDGSRDKSAIAERLHAIFDIMGRALTSNSEELKGAVIASFLEGLDTPDPTLFKTMLGMMSDGLKNAIKELTEFYSSKEWRSFLRHLDC